MKDNTKKTFIIYWESIKKFKISVIFAHLSIVAVTIIGLITPLYLKKLLDIISSDSSINSSLNQAFAIIGVILFLEICSWFLWRMVDFFAIYFESQVIADLSNKCFAYLHLHSYRYFTDNFGGSLVKRVKWFTSAFENIADRVLWNFLPLVTAIIFITITVSRISIWFGLAISVWLIIFLSINFIFTKYKLKFDIRRSAAETVSTGLLADTITNHNDVKLFNGYFREIKKFAAATDDLRRIRAFTWNLGSAFFAVQGIFWIVLEIGFYYFAVKLWSQGLLTPGTFILIQLYIISIFSKIWDFGKNMQRLYESLADAEEMTVILNTPHEIQDLPGAKKLTVTRGEIVFKDVDFNYNLTRSVLKNFNLTIAPKENIALIGASGSGKTTIVKLIFRMHDLTGGNIFIDGQDINKITLESLWENISLVPQDPILFHRSLIDNIRYGRPDATDEEVIEASKLARCHGFVMRTPQGYNTFVGERGVKLSGGERQRVAIARAILKNAPILVLDEATSSLDSRSEHLIQEALDESMKNKTVIVVAHRLSTIKKMNRIIVVDKGEIAECGNHEDLANKEGGIYAKLWQLQAGGFIGR